MEPIYGATGRVVAWLDDNREVTRDLQGNVNAWLREDCVYSLRGQHVGHFVDGNFRDARGAVVAFIAGASGGPVKPARAARPARPTRGARPARPVRGARMARPARSSSWSTLAFDDYATGK